MKIYKTHKNYPFSFYMQFVFSHHQDKSKHISVVQLIYIMKEKMFLLCLLLKYVLCHVMGEVTEIVKE